MVNVAVLGYGTVGSGVVEVINTNHDSINKKAGDEINIKVSSSKTRTGSSHAKRAKEARSDFGGNRDEDKVTRERHGRPHTC